MKPLTQLLNTEKARLLHQLFPDAIPDLLQYVKGMCLTVAEQSDTLHNNWNNQLLTADMWLSLASTAEEKLTRYGTRLHTSSTLFADQLFDGYLALFMVHCLAVYTSTSIHPDRKFTAAVDLLFNP